MNRKRRKLVADFGGTHLRIGFSYEKKIENLSKVRYDKKRSPLELILDYISENSFSFDQVRVCAAGPVEDGKIEITNNGLKISKQEIIDALEVNDVAIFNDAEAACYYLPEIENKSYLRINSAEPKNSTFAYIALGTGLGISCVKKHMGKSIVVSGEGGYSHLPYPKRNKLLIEAINIIRNDFPRISCERLISGPGIELIYNALTKINNQNKKLTSEEIVNLALNDKNGYEYMSCSFLFELLGELSASIALIYGARGGVFLGGGLLERLYPIMPKDLLIKNFLIPGRMKDYVNSIPLNIIKDDLVSLKGCSSFEK